MQSLISERRKRAAERRTCALPVMVLLLKSTSNTKALCVTLMSIALAKELYSFAGAVAGAAIADAAGTAAAVVTCLIVLDRTDRTADERAACGAGGAEEQGRAAAREARGVALV